MKRKEGGQRKEEGVKEASWTVTSASLHYFWRETLCPYLPYLLPTTSIIDYGNTKATVGSISLANEKAEENRAILTCVTDNFDLHCGCAV